jgi:hypothetical protein
MSDSTSKYTFIDQEKVPALLNKAHTECAVDDFQLWVQQSSGLDKCWLWKPFVSGAEIVARYGAQNEAISFSLAAINEWRYQHPYATLDECEPMITPLVQSIQQKLDLQKQQLALAKSAKSVKNNHNNNASIGAKAKKM